MALSKINTNSIADDAVTTAKVNPAQTDITSVGTLTGLTVDGDATLTGANYNITWDKSNNKLQVADSGKITFGASDDLQIYHDGSHSYVSDQGTGGLYLLGSVLRFGNQDNDEHYGGADDDGSVYFKYDNSTKFQTTTNGIVVGGVTPETHHSSMKTVQVGARGFLTPFDSGAVYLNSNLFYNTSSQWEYATAGSGSVLSLNDGSLYYYHAENGSDGTTGATLVERMRLYHNNSNNDNYNYLIANRNSVSTYIINKHSSAPYGQYIQFDSAAPDNHSQYFFRCVDTASTRMTIYSDGDVETSDAGVLTSDIKNKNTITDATSKYDDIKKLKVRNFYWNEDYHPNKKDKKMIGFIAQEFETVFPGLVSESKDEIAVTEKDEDGNDTTVHKDLGTTTKVIKEGKLIPILTKALQECMTKIETLEAKVKALEEA